MIQGKEIHVIDINSEFYGVPAKTLMENAGKGTTEFIIKNIKKTQKNILIICGNGNNGGDGFVAARYLAQRYNITIFLTGEIKDIRTSIAKNNFQKLKNLKIKIFNINNLKKIDELLEKNEIIVDAMLGIGLKGKLREPYLTIVKKINNTTNKTIISVDIPTGIGTDISLKPDYTVTFHDIKIGMNKKNSGEIIIVDIGVPQKAIDYVGPGELKTYYPIPKKESHKGDNGRLLIIGGGPYYGAPALSSFAAQRTGTDLIYLATPKKVAKAIYSYSSLLIKPIKLAKEVAKLSPTLIIKELTQESKLVDDDIEVINNLLEKIEAVLIGPGLGTDKETQTTIKKILNLLVKNDKSIVIDADAIKVVGQDTNIIKNSKAVITPHLKEFKDLTKIGLSNNLNKRKEIVEKWAKKLGIIIVLKGPVDIISNGEITKLNEIHNEAMTVGGTGDVLAGVIGGLLSKKVEPFNAARIGIFINGSAGNRAFEKRSYGLIATDIIDEIPNVLKKYLQ